MATLQQSIIKTNPTRTFSISYDCYDATYYVLYFVGRYLVVITSYCLCAIASLYATGSLVTLEATNFFCPSYTLEEIRQYNFEHGNEQGSSDSCLRIERQGINLNVLLDTNHNIFTGTIRSDSLDFIAYFEALLYFAAAFILFICTLYQTYFLIYDTVYAIYSAIFDETKNKRISGVLAKLHKHRRNGSGQHARSSNISDLVKDFYHWCYRKYKKLYQKHVEPFYYVDSKWRMLSIIAREWFEVGIQVYALLLYGGINVFDLEANVLSQEPHIIETFSVIVALNCITGICMSQLPNHINCNV